jgi:hypothetical protein
MHPVPRCRTPPRPGVAINRPSKKLELLRYSLFVVLYPLGFLAEVALMVIGFPSFTVSVDALVQCLPLGVLELLAGGCVVGGGLYGGGPPVCAPVSTGLTCPTTGMWCSLPSLWRSCTVSWPTAQVGAVGGRGVGTGKERMGCGVE